MSSHLANHRHDSVRVRRSAAAHRHSGLSDQERRIGRRAFRSSSGIGRDRPKMASAAPEEIVTGARLPPDGRSVVLGRQGAGGSPSRRRVSHPLAAEKGLLGENEVLFTLPLSLKRGAVPHRVWWPRSTDDHVFPTTALPPSAGGAAPDQDQHFTSPPWSRTQA